MIAALLNPYMLLVAALLGGTWLHGYSSNRGAEKVQAAWDRAEHSAQAARAKRLAAAQATQERLQQAADKERKEQDAANKKRDAALAAALGELRKRPARPDGPRPGDVPQASGSGSQGGGCTGAGLYRDDAEFLARHADLAQRIRTQRDACYRQYERAQSEIEKLRRPSD